MDREKAIFSYSRGQALADGVLVDITNEARRIGIKYPVAVTDTLYRQWIEVSSTLESEGQTTKGRVDDLLFMLVFAIRTGKEVTDSVHFQVSFQMEAGKQEAVPVWASIGGGDDGKPVITIMLGGED